MNGKVLRVNKIDERYILSPKKFLYTFGYMCLGDKLVNSNLNKRQLNFFLEQVLTPVPEEMVTYENVATGNVILIGRGNNFNAYLRPRDIREEIETKPKEVKEQTPIKPNVQKKLSDLSLSQLITLYKENITEETAQIYIDEIKRRALNNNDIESNRVKMQKRHVKTYYKKIH